MDVRKRNWITAELDVWSEPAEPAQNLNVHPRMLPRIKNAEEKEENLAEVPIWEKNSISNCSFWTSSERLFQNNNSKKRSRRKLRRNVQIHPIKNLAKRKSRNRSLPRKRNSERLPWKHANVNPRLQKNARERKKDATKKDWLVAEEDVWEELAEIALKLLVLQRLLERENVPRQKEDLARESTWKEREIPK